MNSNNRLEILNVWVDPVTRKEAVVRVREFLANGDRPHWIFASNPEKNYSVPRDPVLYDVYRNADMLLPDGIGMVMAARLLYGLHLKRVPGSEFIFDICRVAEEENKAVFLYGAKENVSREACNRLLERFPNLNIVGRCNGYLPEGEMETMIRQINNSGAEILFVALGSPKQEQWCARYVAQLENIKVIQGIGGTLDTIAGTVKRAPEFWCRMNLEWFYRLIKDPKRIRRQKVLPLFVASLIACYLKKTFSKAEN